MKILSAFTAVAALVLVAFVGVQSLELHSLFGIVIPYAAFVAFVCGLVYRVLKWASSPVPFHIPIVCGQQRSLPWIKPSTIDSPYTRLGVVKRMLGEILLFRSLFRNERARLKEDRRLEFGGNRSLWLAGLAFHWSLFFILLRHIRFFTEPVPMMILFFRTLDGLLQILLLTLFISDVVILISLTYLFLRRVIHPQIRYLSIFADYFALLLVLGIVVSGLMMKLFFRVDIMSVKRLAMSLLTFRPLIPPGLEWHFYLHFFLSSVLVAYLPFSKLMHGAGVFLSPTLNMKNDSRMRRHVNPWAYPVKERTYEEYEDEFRDIIKKAGLPLERN